MKIQLFSLSGLWCGLQKFLWPFSIFLRSLMPKKCSGMQKSCFWTGFHHKKLTNQKSHSTSLWYCGTGKSLSETFIFASINPQYDNRLFMELPWKLQAQNMGRTWAEHGQNMFCACIFHGNSMNNLLSYCGLVDARISASEKDLPTLNIG